MKSENQYFGLTKKEYLIKLAKEGLLKKYDISRNSEFDKIKNRLDYELKIIFDKGFEENIIAAYEIVKFTKDSDILVGPGCGATGGFITMLCIGNN